MRFARRGRRCGTCWKCSSRCVTRRPTRVASDFKGLQDVLGEFQDGEVQANALHLFAQEMLDAGEVDANALLAMGELSARFEPSGELPARRW